MAAPLMLIDRFGSVYMKKRTTLECVKKENSRAINIKAAVSAPISLVQRKNDICSCYG